MSLQVWLPLTKDLRQQGLLQTPAFSLSAFTQESGGKLGQYCYTDRGIIHFTEDFLANQWSLACWVKSTSWSANNDIILCKNASESTSSQFYLSIINGTSLNLGINGGSSNGAGGYSYAFSTNTWYHVAATYDGTNYAMYINGNQVKSGACTTTKPTNLLNLGIGCRSTNAGGTASTGNANKRLNDVRIYNHCLSSMEVKELAKGLVLHYPLNRQGLGPSNLIKNGFGELGTENWTNSSNISTTDIPSGQSDIKISVTNNYTVERIKIYPTHTYKFSAWIKATTTSGNTYPSLFPYDVDGKFIDYYKCSDSFNLNTMTTLKQQLKTGDTKIYVNDLSQWNANSGHYYNWAAIFSYTDSTGYTYPDGTYTQNLGRFGSSTNAKTNLDKTNNIITLTTAYTGPNMPVGTKLCASTEGSTYYYPLGGISLANIQDWTYKEGTFSASTARLKYAKEVMFYTYSNNRMAGIKLQDLTNESLNGTTEYDCSGFCNNGTQWAYDSAGVISYISNTPKYSVSTFLDSANNTTNTASGTQYIYGDCALVTPQYLTVAFWCKPIAGYGNSTGQGQFSLTNNNIGADAGSDYQGGPMNHRDSIIDINGSNGTTHKTVSINFTANEWHHYVIVYDGRYARVYKDGIATATADMGSTMMLGSMKGAVIGFSKAGGVWRSNKSYYSDFRIYATALSADDVKSLYQNNAYIDSSGNVYGAVYNEV